MEPYWRSLDKPEWRVLHLESGKPVPVDSELPPRSKNVAETGRRMIAKLDAQIPMPRCEKLPRSNARRGETGGNVWVAAASIESRGTGAARCYVWSRRLTCGDSLATA